MFLVSPRSYVLSMCSPNRRAPRAALAAHTCDAPCSAVNIERKYLNSGCATVSPCLTVVLELIWLSFDEEPTLE